MLLYVIKFFYIVYVEMSNKRSLIILYEKHLIKFILFEYKGRDVNLLASTQLRLWDGSINFSISDYILSALTVWGQEIGTELIKEKVPIIPQVEGNGVSEIYILSYKEDDDLYSITKNLYVKSKEINKQGAMKIAKLINFKNLVFVSLDHATTSIVRYKKENNSNIKVVAETKDFNLKDYYNKEDFLKNINMFSSALGIKSIDNYLYNSLKLPIINIESIKASVIEYFLNISRLEYFNKCKKLDLKSFGSIEGGDIHDNLLIISGESSRLVNNVPLEILSILSNFDIKGEFSIYFDEYGFLDYLQGCKRRFLPDKTFKGFLQGYWGHVITISGGKKIKLGEVVADVDIKDSKSEMQVIPMYGRILNYEFSEEGEVNLDMKKGFSFGNKRGNVNIKDISGNFIIDSRDIYKEKIYDIEGKGDLLNSWLKGSGVIN